ncbi:hypothetical protein PALB_21330 [Pseudoalteromonas luteoviolacea B = ATCC 29581]|nr:hypothetical protein PALB_21330 [Pseudoalteromonas luteoviolacea B = ATCC 29581]
MKYLQHPFLTEQLYSQPYIQANFKGKILQNTHLSKNLQGKRTT